MKKHLSIFLFSITTFIIGNQISINFQKFFPVTLTVCNESEYDISSIGGGYFTVYGLKKGECTKAIKKGPIYNRNTYEVNIHNKDNDTDEWDGILTFPINAGDNIGLKKYYLGNKTLTIKKLYTNNKIYSSSIPWGIDSELQ